MALVSSTKKFFQTKTKALVSWTDDRIDKLRAWVKRLCDTTRLLAIVGVFTGIAFLVWFWRKHGRCWWRALLRVSNRRPDQDPIRQKASRWLQRQTKRQTFEWPAEVKTGLLQLLFGRVETWPDPDAVFQAAQSAWRSV